MSRICATLRWHARAAFCVIGTLFVGGAVASADDSLEGVTAIDTGIAQPESPTYIGRTLYYVGYGSGVVVSWDKGKRRTIYFDSHCGPTSIIPFGDDLLLACYEGNSIVRIRTDGTVVSRKKEDKEGRELLAPDELIPDGRGGAYLTASGPPLEADSIGGKVYHVAPDLAATELARDVHFANGIAMSPDGQRLLVSESEAHRIISFSLNKDGTLSDRRLFARLDKLDPKGGINAYPDRIKFGPDGNLWIGEYSKPRIAVITADGKTFIRGYDFPGEACPNIAFTPHGRSFVAAVWPGTLYEVPMRRP